MVLTYELDPNPLRTGLVERTEEFRWNSLGYHIDNSGYLPMLK